MDQVMLVFVIVHKSFRYRIYPTPEQATRLDRWSDALRFLWNLANEQRLTALARPRGYRKYYTAFDQINELTELRSELPWLAEVPRNVCAQLLMELDLAWQRCFKRLASQPNWKRKGRNIVSITEPHPKVWRLVGDQLVFPKLGAIDLVLHRPPDGTLKTCTIKRDVDQWFASISCEIEIADPTPSTKPPIGIDRGCVNIVVDSLGCGFINPHHLEDAQKRLARAQRTVSRRKKGSKNREKAKLRVAKLHRKVRRQRDALLHRMSKYYANNHGKIFVERLNIQSMSIKGGARKSGLNRSILSAGWGKFVELCTYKAIPLGGEIVYVNPAYTSQICSACGHQNVKNRISQSEFCCVLCGHYEHADVNAAKNILSRGLKAVELAAPACGGFAEVRRPEKQELRVARRRTRSEGQGLKPPSFRLR